MDSIKDSRLVNTIEQNSGGQGALHHWKIGTKKEDLKPLLDAKVEAIKRGNTIAPTISADPVPSSPQDETFGNSWFAFRSLPEKAIAEELTKRNILFFCNAKCSVTNRHQIPTNKEVDFLVFVKGVSRILEVDGREYHPIAAEDHERDRLFERHGLRTARFTAARCISDPADVIDEFLELMGG